MPSMINKDTRQPFFLAHRASIGEFRVLLLALGIDRLIRLIIALGIITDYLNYASLRSSGRKKDLSTELADMSTPWPFEALINTRSMDNLWSVDLVSMSSFIG